MERAGRADLQRRHAVSLWAAAAILVLFGGGCLYLPPPPGAVASLPEDDTSFSLHFSADLAGLARGEGAAALGFFPAFRLALTDDQEMVFFPWPAYRHWVCAGDDRRIYHQFALGNLHPLARGGAAWGQYLRYDLRVVDPVDADDRTCRPLGPRDNLSAYLVGFYLSAATRAPGSGRLALSLGPAVGLASDRMGATAEPALLTLRERAGLRAAWFAAFPVGIWAGR